MGGIRDHYIVVELSEAITATESHNFDFDLNGSLVNANRECLLAQIKIFPPKSKDYTINPQFSPDGTNFWGWGIAVLGARTIALTSADDTDTGLNRDDVVHIDPDENELAGDLDTVRVTITNDESSGSATWKVRGVFYVR